MRDTPTPEMEKFRVTEGNLASTIEDGCLGVFKVITPVESELAVIVSSGDGIGWEHVSVSVEGKDYGKRLPSWMEMNWIKEQFWNDEECVAQLHPPKSKYVNYNPLVLHLWRIENTDWRTPPRILIAP